MGNHDYWSLNNTLNSPKYDEEKQKLFEEKTKEKPYTHKIINGYHFINWSCDNYSFENPYTNFFWLEKQIELAKSPDN